MLLLTAHSELLNSKVALYFPSDLNHPLKCLIGRPKDNHVGGSNTFEMSYI